MLSYIHKLTKKLSVGVKKVDMNFFQININHFNKEDLIMHYISPSKHEIKLTLLW